MSANPARTVLEEKIRVLERRYSSAENEVDEAEARLGEAKKQLEALDVVAKPSDASEAVRDWLGRERFLGLLTADQVSVVERLIGDIR